MSPAVLAIIGTVLGGLVTSGAVTFYLARPNRRKLEADTAAATEQATNMAVKTVELALDRQDKTIARQDAERERQDSEMILARAEIDDLGGRVSFLEKALAAAVIAEHLSAGRELVLRAEIVRLGGDSRDALGDEITDIDSTAEERSEP